MITTLTFNDEETDDALLALNAHSMYISLYRIGRDCRSFMENGSDLTTEEFAKMIMNHCQEAKQLTD